jgi:hypothetical protein
MLSGFPGTDPSHTGEGFLSKEVLSGRSSVWGMGNLAGNKIQNEEANAA